MENEEQNCAEVVSRLVGILRGTLETKDSGQCPVLDSADYPDIAALAWDLARLRDFAHAVSQGDISRKLIMKGFMAGALKSLQANLAHLTWQTKMIASGDLSQRVDFMGEFSRAFNSMVSTLEDNQRQILRKEEELRLANAQLREEVARRAKAQMLLQRSQDRYKTLAMRDGLSGLYNRRFFFLLAKRELRRAARLATPVSIILFDIDFFKKINDTLGHAAGDSVIRSVGRLTRNTVREIDLAGRYGGEEFVVFLPDCGLASAARVAERLRRTMDSFDFFPGVEAPPVTASFGVAAASSPRDCGEPNSLRLDRLAAKADEALYRAKEAGRNRVVSEESDC